MALRLLQVVLPRRHRDELATVLREADPPDHWQAELNDDHQLTTVLVRAAAVESLTDALTDHFNAVEGYRLVLLPVQATTPEVPDPEPPPPADASAADTKPKWKPLIGRVSREELQETISRSGKPDGLFLAMTVLATVVAAVGLLKDSPAIIIGAMVIAPLLGPNMALALGTTLGDLKLIKRCVKTNVIGMTIAFGLSGALGLIANPDRTIPEIAARTAVDAGDIALALASGAAGALAFTAGAHATVVGVMVAVALLPPATVVGLMVGSGEWRSAANAGMLLGVNIVSVNLAATLVFLVQGVRPDRWWHEDRAQRSARTALVIWLGLLALLAGLLVAGL